MMGSKGLHQRRHVFWADDPGLGGLLVQVVVQPFFTIRGKSSQRLDNFGKVACLPSSCIELASAK